MAPLSGTLAWRIPWTVEPGRLQSGGTLRATTEPLHFHFSLSCIGEGNGNPLQCSCLENPRDGGDWWVAIYGGAQSRTWLKHLSSSSSYYKTCPHFLLALIPGLLSVPSGHGSVLPYGLLTEPSTIWQLTSSWPGGKSLLSLSPDKVRSTQDNLACH